MRDILDLGGVKMLRVHEVGEILREDVDAVDLIAVRGKTLPGAIIAPPRVEWFMPVTASNLTEHFSGNYRRKLKRTYEQMQTIGITLQFHEHVSQEQFTQFLSVYREVIGSKEHPRLRLSEKSFVQLQEHPLHGVYAYQHGRCIGGMLVRDYGEYYSLSYSAYRQFPRAELELGLGVPLCDVVYQRSCFEKRVRLSYGMDTNVYGFHLGIGLLEYKLSMGYAAVPKELDGDMVHSLYIMRSPTRGTAAWYEYDEPGLGLAVASDVHREELRTFFWHSTEARRVISMSEHIATARESLVSQLA